MVITSVSVSPIFSACSSGASSGLMFSGRFLDVDHLMGKILLGCDKQSRRLTAHYKQSAAAGFLAPSRKASSVINAEDARHQRPHDSLWREKPALQLLQQF